jgi:deoxyuridine 5'-triphosphate nucleotidohydrolase
MSSEAPIDAAFEPAQAITPEPARATSEPAQKAPARLKGKARAKARDAAKAALTAPKDSDRIESVEESLAGFDSLQGLEAKDLVTQPQLKEALAMALGRQLVSLEKIMNVSIDALTELVDRSVEKLLGQCETLAQRVEELEAAAEEPVFRVVRTHPDAKLPMKANPDDAGFDLSAVEEALIEPGKRALIKTGLIVHVPDGCYGRVAPRSGLAYKKGIDVFAGVVDSTYLGEVGVILYNSGEDPFQVSVGDRIAQFVIEKIAHPALEEVADVSELGESSRGAGGFGSTGV